MNNFKIDSENGELVCKYCHQQPNSCPCDDVDDFFENSWDLMNDDSWKAIVPKDIKDID